MNIFSKKVRAGEKELVKTSSRVSRLISDLKSKRDIVQTGFPTSVADLVINSGIEWVPPNKKRRNSRKSSKRSSQCESRTTFSDSTPRETQTLVTEVQTPKASDDEFNSILTEKIAEIVEPDPFAPVERICSENALKDNCLRSRERFKVIALLFLFCVMAMVTKELAVSVTLLVLLLLLVEYVGVRCHLLSPEVKWLRGRSLLYQRGLMIELGCLETQKDGDLDRQANCFDDSHSPSDFSASSEVSNLGEMKKDDEFDSKSSSDEICRPSKKPSMKKKFLRKFSSKLKAISKNGKACETEVCSDSSSELGSFKGERCRLIDERDEDVNAEFSEHLNLEDVLLIKKSDSNIRQDVLCLGSINLDFLILMFLVLAGLVVGRLFALVMILPWFYFAKGRKSATSQRKPSM